MRFNPDNGAEIYANSGCKLGPAGLPPDDDTWNAGAFTVADMVTDTGLTVTITEDTAGMGGRSSTS